MSGPGAGFEYPPVEVAWLKRDVLLFANSIGCTADELHFLFVCLHGLTCFYNVLTPPQRNCTRTLQSSLHIQSFYVSNLPQIILQVAHMRQLSNKQRKK